MKQINPTAAATRRYYIQAGMLAAFYVFVLFGSLAIVNEVHPTGFARYALLLAPVVPVALLVPAIVRYFRDTDEFERRIMTESLAIAAAVTALFSVTYGFLEIAGLPHLSAWATWAVVMIAWAIARSIVARHYQ